MTDANRNFSSKTISVTTTGTAASVSAKAIAYATSYTNTTGAVQLNGGNSTASYGTLNYAWTILDSSKIPHNTSATFTTQGPVFTANRGTIDSIYKGILQVSDATTGCKVSSDTVLFTVNRFVAALSPNFTKAHRLGISDACADSVTFTNTTSGGAGPQSYTWYFGDGGSYTTTSKAPFGYKYAHSGPFNVQLNVTDSASGTVGYTDTVKTNGTPASVIASAAISGQTYSASTSTVILNGGGSTASYGTLSYLWTVTTGSDVSTFTTQSVTFTGNRGPHDSAYTAVLMVSDPLTGCRTNTATTLNFTINHTVPTLTPNFTKAHRLGISDACADSVTFTNTTSGGAGPQ